MDQNNWNQNDSQFEHDRTSDAQRRAEHSYTNSYTYHSASSSESKKNGKAGRVALIAVAVLLGLVLCFGAGVAGSLALDHLLYDAPYKDMDRTPTQHEQNPDLPKDSDTVPDAPISTDTPAQTDGTGEQSDVNDTQSSISGDDQQPNPLPHMDKSTTIGEVGYAGSAGNGAYTLLTEAIDAVNETVVEIFTETLVNNGWLGDFVQEGAGSGVIISKDGYIVTNNHVISGASTITVRMTDQTTYEARVVGTDEASDIAVLWIDTEHDLSAAQMGCSADLIVGESVFAIGNPLGSLGGTVTDGIISATARDITIDGQPMTLLQTNAAVNPGNSGGGLFNMAGQLIGVVNAKYSQDAVEGLGFAIPIDTAYEVICQLIEYGYVRGVVDAGLDLYDITSSNILVALRYFGMSYSGVYVLESAYSDQVKYGDLLVSIDGVAVTTADQAQAEINKHAVGDTVTLTLLRLTTQLKGGREVSVETEVTVELTLREYVPEDVGIRFDEQ